MSDQDRLADARSQAKAQYDSIAEMVMRFRASENDRDSDAARQEMEENALSVEIRSGWAVPGSKLEAAEFQILLCTGGPAVRIIGQLNSYGEPETATLQCQDWFTPWVEAMAYVDDDILLDYCRVFYFGK